MKQEKNNYSIAVLSSGSRTAFQLNETTLIDAGSVTEAIDESCASITEIWLTHSHLDHIVDIAFMLDDYFELRKESLTIVALPKTIKALQENFLNDTIWPDFSKIPLFNSNEMVVKYREISENRVYRLSSNETIEAFLTDHTIDSCGYIYTYKDKSIVIATDTYSLENIVHLLQKRETLKDLILECSFPNSMQNIAEVSKHLTPELLFRQLDNCTRDDFRLHINHIKPSYREKIMQEIEENRGEREVFFIKNKEILYFS